MKTLNYHFNQITHCNMCGDKTDHHKILGIRLNQSQGFSPKSKTGISTSVVKCTNCELIYSNPQPVPHDIQDHYGIPPEGYWIPEYFEIQPWYFLDQITKAKKFLPFQPGMKVLDVGAGIGKGMIALEKAGFDPYGFEPSIPFYERAVQRMEVSPQKLKLGMLENVEYEDNFFDFITFGAVLEHLYDPDKSIAKAIKWLKPNGLIHIEVPSSKYFMSTLCNIYFRLRGTNYVTDISPMHSPFHLHEFSVKTFEENQKRNNYTIEFSQYHVCEIAGIPKMLHPPLKWYMKKTNTGMQLEIWLRKNNNNTGQ